ncbi:pyridoxal phosphate-dependent aminotransferase [Neptunicoccus sediminis]|uniref:pyridoxal phosphate-dependent aminotransferase n=1 Tax=Neptunicoccus sediminis TaxID=1892596 RepID=UPI00084601B1|nr:aminotransferase class I/II-fold pyridoxal phosphate-dependent enzyme [Neptunicoccus sediminis]
MRISSRGAVDPFIVMDVMDAAHKEESKGRSIIHMEVGQPGTAAPQTALDLLSAEMAKDPMGYTVALGRPDLRARIARLYKDWYGVTLSPDRIIVTAGSSAAFTLAFTTLFDANERVAIGEPGYPSYRNILKALSLEPVGIQTQAENRYQPSLEDIKAESDLAGLLVASPANPSGTMLDKPALKELMDHCAAQNIAFISDEIYHGIQYEGRAVSALEISDDVFVINSFSKYFSMTGWRIGWMVVPETHVRAVERLAQNMFICAPHAAQIAALGAMDAEAELTENFAVYAENRRLMLEELPKMGFDRIAPPDGAFYVYADITRWSDDSAAFCAEILRDAGVSVTPGLDFDPKRGHQTIRFSYARSAADIREGLDRLAAFMAKRGE